MLIDITDRSQAGGGYQSGNFTRLADSLTIDLSNRENEQAKKYIQRKENYIIEHCNIPQEQIILIISEEL